MACEAYIEHKFSAQAEQLIAVIDDIITDYQAQGYVLTVRQLYYQLVAKALIPNEEKSYKRITGLVNDARMAGRLDWDGIEDRTRSFKTRSRWSNGGEILEASAAGYHQDMWENQDHRVFVIVEKEALAGVLQRVCTSLDVPLLAARGYPSSSVLREFVESDVLPATDGDGKAVVILHLGDHDPSGIDMTRDLDDRIQLFARGASVELHRIALNMDQIEEVQPPENPAKSTDARFADYRRRFGNSSWELDALKPAYLDRLVRTHVERYIDPERWTETAKVIANVKDKLRKMAAKLG